MSVDGARRGDTVEAIPGRRPLLAAMAGVVLVVLLLGVAALREPFQGPLRPEDLALRVTMQRYTSAVDAQTVADRLAGADRLVLRQDRRETVYLVGQLHWTRPEGAHRGMLHVLVRNRVNGAIAHISAAARDDSVGRVPWDPRLSDVTAEVDWLSPLRAHGDDEPFGRGDCLAEGNEDTDFCIIRWREHAAFVPVTARSPLTFAATFEIYPRGLEPHTLAVGVVFLGKEDTWWARQLVP